MMDILPILAGLQWDVTKTPEFSTIVQRSASLMETRVALAAYPLYTFDSHWDLLRDDQSTQAPSSPSDELKKLMGFFLKQNGRLRAFLYADPSDSSVVKASFGTGDASTTQFQLTRTYGAGGFGFTEPVQNVNGTPSVFRTDWQGEQLLFTTARTNLAPRSQDFTTRWSYAALSLTSSSNPAPDGTSTAGLFTTITGTSFNFLYDGTLTVTGGADYTSSIYVKVGAGTQWFFLRYADSASPTDGFDVWFDAVNGLVGTHNIYGSGVLNSASITPMSAAGWFRIKVSGHLPIADTTAAICLLNPTVSNGSLSGPTVGSTFYAWGAQVETGNSVTPYVPTVAVAVTVTDYALSAAGLVTTGQTPAAGATLTWSGSYYYRCRFVDDTTDFNEFMYQLWENKSMKFVGAVGNKV